MSDLSERRPVNTDYAVSLLEQLKFFYEQKLLTDVVLLVEDTEFPCHKMVLATCSSYFRWVRLTGMEYLVLCASAFNSLGLLVTLNAKRCMYAVFM